MFVYYDHVLYTMKWYITRNGIRKHMFPTVQFLENIKKSINGKTIISIPLQTPRRTTFMMFKYCVKFHVKLGMSTLLHLHIT